MLQTYKFNSHATNRIKLDSIRELGYIYRKYYNMAVRKTIPEFYRSEGKIPKYLPRFESYDERFSERYKQTCGKQVKTNLKSWLSNIRNRIRDTITGSDLSKETKKILYTINKSNLWFKKAVIIKGKPVSQDMLKLSRKIFHHCRGSYPKLRNITMNLDAKVAVLEKSENSFDYWIKMSTLDLGNPIYLPVESYRYYEGIRGLVKRQIQIIIRPDKIEYGFIKDVIYEKKPFIKGKVIGIDTGVVIPISTSTGNQYGQDLYRKLKWLDERITKLFSSRRMNGFYKNSPALDQLYKRAQNLLKNEVGRITNEFLNNEKPEEIVLEANKNITKDLKNFSKKMKRLIINSGITRIRDELKRKSKRDGSKSIESNQAYTSQDCPECHHVDRNNRKSQKVFKCVKCGFTRNADYVGAVNVRDRRSITSVDIYTPYKLVRGLLEAYYEKKKLCVTFQKRVPIVVPNLTTCTRSGMIEEDSQS